MKDEFYIVLPSNSSMEYHPDNKTTRYITHLPQCLTLHGGWTVSLAEIQIPLTMMHVPPEGERNFISFITNAVMHGTGTDTNYKEDRVCVPPGVYRSIDDLLETINDIPCVSGHLRFQYGRNGYVTVTRICNTCKNLKHSFFFSVTLNKILGFSHNQGIVVQSDTKYIGQRPAGLTNGLPNTLFVYTDICEPYITGDVHTPLLRVVPITETANYNYGSVKIRSFSPPRFIPLLRTSFQTITIDIRDEFGEPIPFEYGTLTVTLHFRRED